MARVAEKMGGGFGASLWAMERYLRDTNRPVSERIRSLRLEVGRELGLRARAVHGLLGPILLFTSRREARRFPKGRPLEPQTFVDRRGWSGKAVLDSVQ
jgi:hypothetical protein